MRRFIAVAAFAIAAAAAAFAQEVLVEFRAAAETPAEGLTEMTADGSVYFVAPEAILTNADIEDADAALDPVSGLPVVNVAFTAEGGRKFADYTRDHVLGVVAILIDGEIVSAPRINEPILGGRAVISGNFTKSEAERIARGIVPGKE